MRIVEQITQGLRHVVAIDADEVLTGDQRCISLRRLGDDDAAVGHRLHHPHPLEIGGGIRTGREVCAAVAMHIDQNLGPTQELVLGFAEDDSRRPGRDRFVEREQPQLAVPIPQRRRQTGQGTPPPRVEAAHEQHVDVAIRR